MPHGAARVNVGPLQGDRDAVEEDEDQDDVIKHLVSNDLLAGDAEPGGRGWGFRDSPGQALASRPQGPRGGAQRSPRGRDAGAQKEGSAFPGFSQVCPIPVLWGEEVQGPGLAAPTALGLVGLQHFLQPGAAALGRGGVLRAPPSLGSPQPLLPSGSALSTHPGTG